MRFKRSFLIALLFLGIFTLVAVLNSSSAFADTKTGTYFCAWNDTTNICSQVGDDSCRAGYTVDPACSSLTSQGKEACEASIAGGISKGLKACQSVSRESYYYCQWTSTACQPLGDPNCAKGFE